MSGEYEPKDSRNVTGTGSSPDDRWTSQGGKTPDAAGQPQQQGGAAGQPGTFTGGSGGQAGNSQAGSSDRDQSGQQGGKQEMGGGGAYPENGQQRQFDQSGGQQGGFGDQSRFADQIRAHMTVVDAEGTQIGTVDRCEDGRIKLTRNDSSDGQHHYVEMTRVAGIEGDQVRLNDSGDSVFGSGAK